MPALPSLAHDIEHDMKNDERDPMVKCSRKRPACGHSRREHGDGRCFGVTFVERVAGDCHCRGMMEPPDPPRYARSGEVVDE